MSKYTTGEMAKLCNVSVRAVQFYDTKELLVPSELTEGGRRLYNDDDLTKLRLICTLKVIGLSLDLIKGILESESSGKILSLLLDEQMKQLDDEIKLRQRQQETIKAIKESIRDTTTIPVESIIDIENVMENKKKHDRAYAKLITLAFLISIPSFGAIALWIASGVWIPFVVYFPIQTLLGVLIAKHHFKTSAFICAECNCMFKPTFSKLIRTSGTRKARWLACTICGHKGYCVETYAEGEVVTGGIKS